MRRAHSYNARREARARTLFAPDCVYSRVDYGRVARPRVGWSSRRCVSPRRARRCKLRARVCSIARFSWQRGQSRRVCLRHRYPGGANSGLEPCMVQQLLHCRPVHWLHHEQIGNKIFGICGDVLPFGLMEFVLCLRDKAKNRVLFVSRKRRATAKDDVQQDAKRPQIRALAVRRAVFIIIVPTKHFRRHIVGRAAQSGQLLVRFPPTSVSEIDELDLGAAVAQIQDILWLHTARVVWSHTKTGDTRVPVQSTRVASTELGAGVAHARHALSVHDVERVEVLHGE